ncbi:hypothetical protein P7C70_g8655, partial [Phenoliferia sp. Uapishka_3]
MGRSLAIKASTGKPTKAKPVKPSSALAAELASYRLCTAKEYAQVAKQLPKIIPYNVCEDDVDRMLECVENRVPGKNYEFITALLASSSAGGDNGEKTRMVAGKKKEHAYLVMSRHVYPAPSNLDPSLSLAWQYRAKDRVKNYWTGLVAKYKTIMSGFKTTGGGIDAGNSEHANLLEEARISLRVFDQLHKLLSTSAACNPPCVYDASTDQFTSSGNQSDDELVAEDDDTAYGDSSAVLTDEGNGEDDEEGRSEGEDQDSEDLQVVSHSSESRTNGFAGLLNDNDAIFRSDTEFFGDLDEASRPSKPCATVNPTSGPTSASLSSTALAPNSKKRPVPSEGPVAAPANKRPTLPTRTPTLTPTPPPLPKPASATSKGKSKAATAPTIRGEVESKPKIGKSGVRPVASMGERSTTVMNRLEKTQEGRAASMSGMMGGLVTVASSFKDARSQEVRIKQFEAQERAFKGGYGPPPDLSLISSANYGAQETPACAPPTIQNNYSTTFSSSSPNLTHFQLPPPPTNNFSYSSGGYLGGSSESESTSASAIASGSNVQLEDGEFSASGFDVGALSEERLAAILEHFKQ